MATQRCPCGFFGDPTKECTCPLQAVERYRARVSGPLLDRIDLHIEVPAVPFRALAENATAESSETIRRRVERARRIQLRRFKGTRVYCNAQMATREARRHCAW